MRYCADTNFLLALFGLDSRAKELFDGVKRGKDWIIVSYVAYAETIKKLFQFGRSQSNIDSFLELLENTEKVRFVEVDKLVAQEAAKVALTFNVPMIDACIVACAKVTNCDVLLSNDSDYNLAKRKYIKVQSW